MPTTLDQTRLGQTAIIPSGGRPEGLLEVVVLHTTAKGTLQALKTAARIAQGLAAQIRLLVPQAVPYPLPLDSPPIPKEFTERRFRTVVSEAAVETYIDIRLCRDRWVLLESALRPRSLVVLSGRRSWWPTSESRLAGRLQRLGHQVVFASLK
jgi:hypothetical protein